MSYSVNFIGKPEAIRRKLQETSEKLVGNSKLEFDEVLPALNTILDQQVGNNAVSLNANGYATFENGQKIYGCCSVEVRQMGLLAE